MATPQLPNTSPVSSAPPPPPKATPTYTAQDQAAVQAVVLNKLVDEINKDVATLASLEKSKYETALHLGQLLNKATATVGHSNWGKWLAAHVKGLTSRSCTTYMELATNAATIEAKAKSEGISDLTITQALALGRAGKATDGNANDAKPGSDKPSKSGNGKSATAQPAAVAKLLKAATNDPEAALEVANYSRDAMLKALRTYRKNHEEEAREMAAGIVDKLREMDLIDD
jgi:hypothetical protein